MRIMTKHTNSINNYSCRKCRTNNLITDHVVLLRNNTVPNNTCTQHNTYNEVYIYNII